MYTLDGIFGFVGGSHDKPSDWFRLTLVYEPDNYLTVYHDQWTLSGSSNLIAGTHTPGPGQVVFGRRIIDDQTTSSSIMADELTLWNRMLPASEVQDIYYDYDPYYTAGGFGGGLNWDNIVHTR